MDVEVVGDVAGRAADVVAEVAVDAVAARGRCALAFSGGTTPAAMFAELATRPVPWERLDVFQVDERVAPDGHPDRNLTALRAALLDLDMVRAAHAYPMPVTAPDLAAAAAGYDARLRDACGGVLDLVHLGLGDDGHTASWPPGDPVVDAPQNVAIVGPYRGRPRMTLTPAAVNRARRVLWLVSGEAKAEMLRRLVEGSSRIPAARVRDENSLVIADQAAARLLRRA
ncbi:MAG: 6-phosphogluconolactonase [Egibacteraceae bacterium]